MLYSQLESFYAVKHAKAPVVFSCAGHCNSEHGALSATKLQSVFRSSIQLSQTLPSGVEALLTIVNPDLEASLQEAGVDSLCKLAAAPQNRQHLTDKVQHCSLHLSNGFLKQDTVHR